MHYFLDFEIITPLLLVSSFEMSVAILFLHPLNMTCLSFPLEYLDLNLF